MIPNSAQKAVMTFRTGAGYFFMGQRYVFSSHPHLLKYALIPMILGVGVFALLAVLFFSGVGNVLDWVWTKPDHWALQVLWYVFATITMILTGITTILAAYLGFMILCAPFNDILSEKVEGLARTFDARPFEPGFFFRDAWQSIIVEVVKVLQKAAWLLPLYLASLFIPVVGQIIYAVVGGYKMSLWLGMDYVDWSLARRGYSAADRLAFAREHRSALRGFGMMMTLVSLVPLGAVVCWPGAVAGGTLLCTGLSPQDRRKEFDRSRRIELSPGD